VVEDPLVVLGLGNYFSDVYDIGIASHYNDGANAHTGIIRDSGTKEWHLFKGYLPEIGANNNVNITDPTFTIDTLNANIKATTITLKGYDVLTHINSAFSVANSASIYANGAFAAANIADIKATSAGIYANGAFIAANSAGVYANAAFAAANIADIKATSAGIYANGAFIQANTSVNNALSAGIYANGAFAAANTDFTNLSIAAGTYGNATHYGVVTVAANGRVTSVQTYQVSVVEQDPNALAFSIALG
jgi:hypothetical protein